MIAPNNDLYPPLTPPADVAALKELAVERLEYYDDEAILTPISDEEMAELGALQAQDSQLSDDDLAAMWEQEQRERDDR